MAYSIYQLVSMKAAVRDADFAMRRYRLRTGVRFDTPNEFNARHTTQQDSRKHYLASSLFTGY